MCLQLEQSTSVLGQKKVTFICIQLMLYHVSIIFNIEKVTEIHEHSRSEDHVDKVTCICSIPTYELFITSSKDGVIKVWNVSNALIREIVFTEPIMFLAVLGRCGDILFGIQNRVDMIKAKNYLPPGYHELISSMIRKKLVKGFDEPINFQENIEYDLDFHKEEPHLRIHLNRLEWLADANLSAVARKTIAKPIPTQDVVATVEVNETLIEKDEQTIENGNFEQVEIDAKFVSANEDFNIENDPEYQMFIRHKNFKYMMADEEVFDEADLLSLPLKNMDRLQSIRPVHFLNLENSTENG